MVPICLPLLRDTYGQLKDNRFVNGRILHENGRIGIALGHLGLPSLQSHPWTNKTQLQNTTNIIKYHQISALCSKIFKDVLPWSSTWCSLMQSRNSIWWDRIIGLCLMPTDPQYSLACIFTCKSCISINSVFHPRLPREKKNMKITGCQDEPSFGQGPIGKYPPAAKRCPRSRLWHGQFCVSLKNLQTVFVCLLLGTWELARVKCNICKINSGSQQKASGTPFALKHSSFFDINIPCFWGDLVLLPSMSYVNICLQELSARVALPYGKVQAAVHCMRG